MVEQKEMCECGFPQSHPIPHEHSHKRQFAVKYFDDIAKEVNQEKAIRVKVWECPHCHHLLKAEINNLLEQAKSQTELETLKRIKKVWDKRKYALDAYKYLEAEIAKLEGKEND